MLILCVKFWENFLLLVCSSLISVLNSIPTTKTLKITNDESFRKMKNALGRENKHYFLFYFF